MVADTLVNTFIMSTEDNHIPFQTEVVGDMLVKLFPVGRDIDHLVIVTLGLQSRDAAVDGLPLHDHTGGAAIGVVVDAPPFVEGIVTEVMEFDLYEAFFLCPCEDTLVEEALNHLRQHGDNIYSHCLILGLILVVFSDYCCKDTHFFVFLQKFI